MEHTIKSLFLSDDIIPISTIEENKEVYLTDLQRLIHEGDEDLSSLEVILDLIQDDAFYNLITRSFERPQLTYIYHLEDGSIIYNELYISPMSEEQLFFLISFTMKQLLLEDRYNVKIATNGTNTNLYIDSHDKTRDFVDIKEDWMYFHDQLIHYITLIKYLHRLYTGKEGYH
jgi:hypothetical protein|nr:MAG TPA: hypothetical protein [Bacteriophage sp.]